MKRICLGVCACVCFDLYFFALFSSSNTPSVWPCVSESVEIKKNSQKAKSRIKFDWKISSHKSQHPKTNVPRRKNTGSNLLTLKWMAKLEKPRRRDRKNASTSFAQFKHFHIFYLLFRWIVQWLLLAFISFLLPPGPGSVIHFRITYDLSAYHVFIWLARRVCLPVFCSPHIHRADSNHKYLKAPFVNFFVEIFYI